MNRLALILLGLGALAALPAHSADWLKNCQTTSAANAQTLQPGSFACTIPTSATDNSDGYLDVSACENIDILYWDDVDGDTTAGGGTGIMRSCPTTGLSTAAAGVGESACWAIENLTLDGNPATNTEAIYGVAANWIFWEQTAYATTTEPIRVMVRCNGTWR